MSGARPRAFLSMTLACLIESVRPATPRDLVRPTPRGPRRRHAGAGVRGAGVPPLPGVQRPRPWLGGSPLRGMRARRPDRVLVPGARRLPLVQHPAHGGDRGPSHRPRLAGPAGAAVACREAESQARKAVVLAVPKRLRYFLHRDAALQGAALRLFLRVVEQCLRAHSPGAGSTPRRGGKPLPTGPGQPSRLILLGAVEPHVDQRGARIDAFGPAPERLRVFRSCPLITPEGARSSLQMLAIA